MARHAGCFQTWLHGQLAHCQQYVKGLCYACRSNVERMNERLPDARYDALHHFLSVGKVTIFKARKKWMNRDRKRLKIGG